MNTVKIIFGVILAISSIQSLVQMSSESSRALPGAITGFLIFGGLSGWLIYSGIKGIQKKKKNEN